MRTTRGEISNRIQQGVHIIPGQIVRFAEAHFSIGCPIFNTARRFPRCNPKSHPLRIHPHKCVELTRILPQRVGRRTHISHPSLVRPAVIVCIASKLAHTQSSWLHCRLSWRLHPDNTVENDGKNARGRLSRENTTITAHVYLEGSLNCSR